VSTPPTPADAPDAGPDGALDAAPVLAIDGPSASGKGTIARRVAQALGFHYLDSGAVYRLAALSALRRGLSLDDEPALVRLAKQLQPRFLADGGILLEGEEVSQAIRDETVGQGASRVAVHAGLRQALLELQLRTRQAPGLVAEGRDMGTVVFPQARLKVFLTASAQSRAERRHKQLLESGGAVPLAQLVEEMRQRDERDERRPVAPLRAAPDAWTLDSTSLTVEGAVDAVLAAWRSVGILYTPLSKG
jgi:cytidylate kinase